MRCFAPPPRPETYRYGANHFRHALSVHIQVDGEGLRAGLARALIRSAGRNRRIVKAAGDAAVDGHRRAKRHAVQRVENRDNTVEYRLRFRQRRAALRGHPLADALAHVLADRLGLVRRFFAFIFHVLVDAIHCFINQPDQFSFSGAQLCNQRFIIRINQLFMHFFELCPQFLHIAVRIINRILFTCSEGFFQCRKEPDPAYSKAVAFPASLPFSSPCPSKLSTQRPNCW